MTDLAVYLILGLIIPAVLILCIGLRDEFRKYYEHYHHHHGHHHKA